MIARKIKAATIFFGDIIILYASLILTLIIRYGEAGFSHSFNVHIQPFSIIFIVWLFIFYLADFYHDKSFKHDLSVIQSFAITIIINIAISMILLYIFSEFFKLTPKTNLLIFGAIFGVLDYFWRLILTKIFIRQGLRKETLIIGNSKSINLIAEYLKDNPQSGYRLDLWVKNGSLKEIEEIISSRRIEMIIIDNEIKKNPLAIKFIYSLLPLEMQIISASEFYEMIFQKVPLEELEETWFIEKIITSRRIYDATKRIIDIVLSFALGIIFSPIIAPIAILIKITSTGPAIYKQERIGKNNKPFILYKFRTMKINHDGPLWTKENDERLTFIGKILRYSHLDEFPQLYNIFKGDISFIGPRPERSELVEMYKKLPYYEIRHIIKPGLTGWAQLNYKPSASVEEAYEKLQYDVYYIKNRSLLLDFLIVLKTIKYLFVNN